MTTTAQYCGSACRQYAFQQRRKQQPALVVQPTIVEEPDELPPAWRLPLQFEGRQVRIVTDEAGIPWFVAADLLALLVLDRTALERIDHDERGVASIHTPGGQQSMTTVNEPGLYSLILSSRKPEAKRFKRWVTHEVLPAIRRTGRYAPHPAPQPLPMAPGIHVIANSPRHARWLWAQAVEAEVSASLMRSVAERTPAPYQAHLLPSTD
jgi:prophage antirepressor-like protein